MRRRKELLIKEFVTKLAFPALCEKGLYENKGWMETICVMEKPFL